MAKKLTKRDKGVSLEIDKKVADALGINQKTTVEIIIKDDTLIVRPKNKRSKAAQKRKKKLLKDQINSLMDEYEPVLKKLAKT